MRFPDFPPGLALLLAAACIACGDNASGPSDVDVTGDYTLTHVDDEAVPRTICTTPTVVRQIPGGDLSLNGDMSYQMSILFERTSGNSVVGTVMIDTGSFTIERSDVRLESVAPNSIWNGTATDSTVSLAVEILSECSVDTFELSFRK